MSGHTPGPWELTDQHLSKDGPPVMDIHDRGMSIARVYVESDTDVANARLMAAAPELLQALRALYDNWLLFARSDSDDVASAVDEQVMAALVKAEAPHAPH